MYLTFKLVGLWLRVRVPDSKVMKINDHVIYEKQFIATSTRNVATNVACILDLIEGTPLARSHTSLLKHFRTHPQTSKLIILIPPQNIWRIFHLFQSLAKSIPGKKYFRLFHLLLLIPFIRSKTELY